MSRGNVQIPYRSNTKALRQRKLRQGQKLIRDSNPDFWINPQPDVCRITAKMYWIHSLVGMSYSAKYRKNLPVTVRMRNATRPNL